MKRLLLVLAMTITMVACDKNTDDAKEAKASEQTPAEFTVVEGTNEEGINELNASSDQVVKQVLKRHDLDPAKVQVRPGEPPGLGFTVSVEGGKKVKLKVPPSKFPAELVTNFDHTLDRAVRRAAGLDEK